MPAARQQRKQEAAALSGRSRGHGRRRRVPRLGAEAPARRGRASRAAASMPLAGASRTATSAASCPEPRPAPATASVSTATRRSIPIPPRASSPTARTARRRSSIRPRSAGRDAAGAASTLDGQVIYEMHVGTFTPRRHLGGGGRASCRGCTDLGVTRDRDDAGRRVPGRVRLGLRRRRPVRADAPLRHARTICARFVDRGARARPRRDPRRRLQPLRPGRELPRRASRDGYFTDALRERVGRRDQLRRRRTPGRCASSSSPTPRYWIDEFHFDGLRLDATQAIHDASPEHILAAIDARGARGGRRRRSIVVIAENEPQHATLVRPPERRRLRPRRALERRLPPHRDGRADRAQRGLLRRTTAARRRSSSPRRSTAILFQGQRYAWQKQAPRHARPRPAAAALRHLPREPRPGRELGARRAAAPADEPRPRRGR